MWNLLHRKRQKMLREFKHDGHRETSHVCRSGDSVFLKCTFFPAWFIGSRQPLSIFHPGFCGHWEKVKGPTCPGNLEIDQMSRYNLWDIKIHNEATKINRAAEETKENIGGKQSRLWTIDVCRQLVYEKVSYQFTRGKECQLNRSFWFNEIGLFLKQESLSLPQIN